MIETTQPVAGTHGGYAAGIIHADYTHSLVGAIVLSATFGIACGMRWGRRSGVVLGLVSFSHWMLDLVMHRADMPLLPGNVGHLPELGFGLWRAPPAAIGAELALVAAGAWLYFRAARSVTLSAGSGTRSAALVSWLILIGGAVVLTLDGTGILG